MRKRESRRKERRGAEKKQVWPYSKSEISRRRTDPQIRQYIKGYLARNVYQGVSYRIILADFGAKEVMETM